MNRKNGGFTIVELLSVLGITVLLLGTVLASVSASKKKAADAEVKKTIAEIALKAEQQDIAPGVMDYQSALSTVGATTTLAQLASKRGVSSGAALGAYDYSISSSNYAILFPLQKGGYYCVDSYTKAVGKEVIGQFQTTGTKTCDTATRTTAPSNNSPVLTLSSPQTVATGVNQGVFTYGGVDVFGVLPASWPEPSYTASDTEDGDLTAKVKIEFPDTYRAHSMAPHKSIFTLLKGVITPSEVEAGGGPVCLGQTTRHYYVTDSNGNTAHAYRDFLAAC